MARPCAAAKLANEVNRHDLRRTLYALARKGRSPCVTPAARPKGKQAKSLVWFDEQKVKCHPGKVRVWPDFTAQQ